MPLLCRLRSKPVSYLQAAFCLHREVTKLPVYSRPHLLLCCENGEGSPRCQAFCRGAARLDRCPITPGARGYTIWTIRELICISGQQFQGRRCFGDADRDLRMCPFLCREMKGGTWEEGGECVRVCLEKEENRKFTKVWMSTGVIRRFVVTIVIKGCKIMQQTWGCSGGLRTVTMCLFLIIYPVIITILAKIKHTHIAHYLGNTAYQKLISC